jgi:hypothetical protein
MSVLVTDIRQAIQALSGVNDLTFEGIPCTVSDINTNEMTCTCTPINGDAEFFDVLLNADADKGFTLIPANNSVVIVQQTSQATAYVSMVSKVDQIYLAGDANGGLVKVQVLNAALNNLQTEINTLKATLSSNLTLMGAALSGVDGGVTSTQAGILSALVLPQINISQIENTTVQHGNG